MLARVLEPEAMDTFEEARDYDAMDHKAVNAAFAADFLTVRGRGKGGLALDLGCGPGRIAIEIALVEPSIRIVALDLAEHMIRLASLHVAEANLTQRVECILGDAKSLGEFAADSFDAVVSNSIIHHIGDPVPVFAEMVRLVRPGGAVFVRDLFRPADRETLDRLVQTYAGEEAEPARELFRASLNAAFTLEEVRAMVAPLGVDHSAVTLTSDRHWTLAWVKPTAA